MEQIRQRAVDDYQLTATATDASGNPAAISGHATVTIIDGGGTTLVDAATAVVESGALTYGASPTVLDRLDTYRAVWTGVIGSVSRSWSTYFEIVGGFLFEINELRASDTELANETRFPLATLELARERAEARLEAAANVAFVRRGARATLSGPAATDWRFAAAAELRKRLKMPHLEVADVYSAVVDGTALTAEEIAALVADDAYLYADSPWSAGRNNIAVHYAHGRELLNPLATYAALMLAKEYALPATAIPSRATVMATDIGSFRINQADATGKTGLPEVDAIVAQIGRSRMAVG